MAGSQKFLFAKLSALWKSIANLTDGKTYGFKDGAIAEVTGGATYYTTTLVGWTPSSNPVITHNLNTTKPVVVIEAIAKTAANGLAIGESEYINSENFGQATIFNGSARKFTANTFVLTIGNGGVAVNSGTGGAASGGNTLFDIRIHVWRLG